MRKFVGAFQLLISLLSLVIAAGTLVNMILITNRPETISVVNAIIGQSILILFFVSLSAVMFKKGRVGFQNQA